MFRPLARQLLLDMVAEEPGPDWLLVPVPPGSWESILRGADLTASLCREIESAGGPVWAPVLSRRRPGRPQRRRRRSERRRVSADVFAVSELPAGVRTVVIIDDVMTTGATLAACTDALLQRYPGLDVAAAVLARAGAPVAGA